MTATPTTALDDLPVSDVDPFAHDVLEDPLPVYQELREAGPVVRLSRYDVLALARYEEVHAAAVDWQRLESGAGVGLANYRTEQPWRPPSVLLEADPPRHDAPRRVLGRVLGQRALHRLRVRWVADAEQLVDEVLGAGLEFDAVRAIAQVFPLRVFPDAVGIGPEGRENLLPYGDHAFNAFGPPNDLVAKGEPRVAELSGWVGEQCAREGLTGDGFGAAIWAAADRGEITPQQAPLMVRSLLTAGVDTTVHGISAVLYGLASHPGEWDRLRADPSLARIAFDEAVRWESPVQLFFRTTTTDVPIGGTVVPAGRKVLMSYAAANRDPRRWSDPDRFDLTRDPSGHMGFGMGLHQCVGQHVARLEAEAVLIALSRRVRSIELAGPVRRHHNNTLRALDSLPLRLTLR
ncbi:cytochrome P450 [Modestobacter roseus]|uniref:cytochrome P450 n=1 Tax=Modestobacter roseus TaxID=1181884 RepID=UPI0034DF27C7